MVKCSEFLSNFAISKLVIVNLWKRLKREIHIRDIVYVYDLEHVSCNLVDWVMVACQ